MTDEPRARQYISSRFPDAKDVAEIGRGVWSVAYGFRSAGRDLVARFGNHRYDFGKDRIASRYAADEVPVPRVLEITEAFDEQYCAVSERVFGKHLDALDGDEMRACLPSLFRTLDALRGADLTNTSGYGMWDECQDGAHPSWEQALTSVGDDRAHHRTHGWRERLAASSERAAMFDEALQCLRSLARSMPAERYLVHNDLLAGNAFVLDGRVSGLIDWGCSMYGDFLYDLAHFVFWRSWYTAWTDIDFASEAGRHYERIRLHVPGLPERLICYQVQIGLDSCSFSAYFGRWEQFDLTMRWVRDLVATAR